MSRLRGSMCGGLLLLALAGTALAEGASVSGKIEIAETSAKRGNGEAANVVVWLSPVSDSAAKTPRPQPVLARLVQKDKSFHPPVIVIPTGSSVEFPNRDPFFHNVFSLFEGKRFDLGLYEAGSSRTVKFDRSGVSYIFCNIHPQMSAVIVSVDTPYYALSDAGGNVVIHKVPPGEYELHVFAEGLSTDVLKGLARRIAVKDDSVSLGALRLPERKLVLSHKNKYGRDYEPTPDTKYEH